MAKPVSFIQAAIPKENGPAKHFETDGLAMTVYRTRDGKPQVEEVHTPQTTLQRIHEVLHARHSSGLGASVDYPGVNRDVAEIVEDCRLHLHHWPWGTAGTTPPEIAHDVRRAIHDEIKASQSEKAKALHPFARFGINLRADAVGYGMGDCFSGKYADNNQRDLASLLISHIMEGRHQLAAAMLHKMFYGETEDTEEKKKDERAKKYRLDGEGDYFKKIPEKPEGSPKPDPIEEIIREHLGEPPECKIEILPLTEPTVSTTDGWRIATTGSRINRPALRRPILPQRLFMKRSPQEPGGAIIFDASGSMHIDNEVLKECCRRAPTAAIAFYKGDDCYKGKIWVFAYNGMRAKDIGHEAKVYPKGNSVDGQAMDWLLAQDGPHIMVTDREFCGASDSMIQKERLRHLEDTGQIQVYTSYPEYMKAYPISESAV